MCGHGVVNQKKENSFGDFGSFQLSAEQGSFPFQHEPAIFLASVKTTTRDAQPLSHPLAAPVNETEFTAIERCGTCILASLLDFVRVLVRI